MGGCEGGKGGPKAKIVRVSEKLFSSLSSKLLWAALDITLAFKLSVFQGHGQFRTSLRLWRKRFHKTSAGKIKKFLQMGISLAYMPLMLSCQDHSWGHKTSIVPWWLREETHSSHSPIIITTAFGQKSDTRRFWWFSQFKCSLLTLSIIALSLMKLADLPKT